MKLKFKNQQFQTDAARAVTDVFRGQRNQAMVEFTHDMGRSADGVQDLFDVVGFHNQPVTVPADTLLENIRAIQMPAQLRPSETIDTNNLRLTIKMETGTGKTYTYIKTMYELNKLYGWSKFIIVVPSIAIREGVCRSFEIMSEHFAAEYGKRIQSFIYDSKQLTKIDQFASYTKLPHGFYINTPVGHYNPDWAVVFHEGNNFKHIYFVAETKGYDKDSLKDYRRAESVKIECASRHFTTISYSHVTYCAR